MSVSRSQVSLLAVRNDLDLTGNINLRHDRVMDRGQSFGHVSLASYKGSCNSSQRNVDPKQWLYHDQAESWYYTTQTKMSWACTYNAPSNVTADAPQPGRVRLKWTVTDESFRDQWVEMRMQGRGEQNTSASVNSYGAHLYCSMYMTPNRYENGGGVEHQAQVAVVGFSEGPGVGNATNHFIRTEREDDYKDLPWPRVVNENFRINGYQRHLMVVVYGIEAGFSQNGKVKEWHFDNVKLTLTA